MSKKPKKSISDSRNTAIISHKKLLETLENSIESLKAKLNKDHARFIISDFNSINMRLIVKGFPPTHCN